MSTESILLKWLVSRANSTDNWFFSYTLEQEVPIYGRLAHQKTHTASTYSRAFRKIREENTLRRYGLELEEHVNKDTKVKGWKIKKLS